MNKIGIRAFIILLPLAISIIALGVAFYNAKSTLLSDHYSQSAQLAATQGAQEMRHYIDQRFAEFDAISLTAANCAISPAKLDLQLSQSVSLRSGFSMYLTTDIDGRVINSALSSNKSNRYVLRKKLSGTPILSREALALLSYSHRLWEQNSPKYFVKAEELSRRLHILKSRGEENSFEARQLSLELAQIRKYKKLPQAVITLAPATQVEQLGLIFDTATYYFSRPIMNCKGELQGYFTAVLDRTLLEDQIFTIRSSFAQGQIDAVDIALVNRKTLRVMSPITYLEEKTLRKYGLNETDEPTQRDELGGLLVNHRITGTLDRVLTVRDLEHLTTDNQKGVSLIIFIPTFSQDQKRSDIAKEVILYVSTALVLFICLTLYLTRYIASPINELKSRVKEISLGQRQKSVLSARTDEIGELFDAFNQMADTISQKEQELTTLANHDSLTGVLNRRALIHAATKEVTVTPHNPASICMIDIDHFKSINDHFGHSIGDQALIEFCQLVTQESRSKDIFGRVGGEEFLLILPSTDLDQAYAIAQRIRSHCEKYIAGDLGLDKAITVSIGVALWQEGGFLAAVSQADKMLYQAKRNGRNRIELQTNSN